MNADKTILIIFILLCSCGQSTNFFIGKWQILKVIEDNNSIDLFNNWMDLKEDGTFESYDGELNKSESGKWSYHIDKNILFIDVKGQEQDSNWSLTLKNDTLIFHSTTEKLRLISRKIE